jgi:hypothetical protein
MQMDLIASPLTWLCSVGIAVLSLAVFLTYDSASFKRDVAAMGNIPVPWTQNSYDRLPSLCINLDTDQTIGSRCPL